MDHDHYDLYGRNEEDEVVAAEKSPSPRSPDASDMVLYAGLDIFDIYKEAIMVQINKDRAHYNVYFTALERYIADKEIVVSGPTATALLLSEPINPTEYRYDLLCRDVVTHARKIASDFYAATKNPYIYVRTKIFGRELGIYVDERELVSFMLVDQYKGVDLLQNIGHSTVRGYFEQNAEIKVLTPEIQLIDMYRMLYSPAASKKWIELKKRAEKMMQLFLSEIVDDRLRADIVKEEKQKRKDEEADGVEGSRDADPYAAKLEQLGAIHVHDNIWISDQPMDVIAAATGIKEFNQNTLKLPYDFRLRRTVFFKAQGESRTAAFFVYNSMQYDLMNTSVYVRLRFILIEIWVVRLVRDVGAYEPAAAEQKIASFLRVVRELNEEISGASLAELFPLDFVGTYYDEIIARKQQMIEMKKSYTPNWYPVKTVV